MKKETQGHVGTGDGRHFMPGSGKHRRLGQ